MKRAYLLCLSGLIIYFLIFLKIFSEPQKVILDQIGIMQIYFLYMLISMTSLFPTQDPNVQVNINGIRSTDGVLSIGVYKSEESFENENPFKTLSFSKDRMQDGTVNAQFYLPPGTYGISLLDDENENDEMDYNFIGMPVEGFGFSDYYHTGLSRPELEDFLINIGQESTNQVTIKIRYL